MFLEDIVLFLKNVNRLYCALAISTDNTSRCRSYAQVEEVFTSSQRRLIILVAIYDGDDSSYLRR